ncbi:ATPase [Mycobacterium deserti]|uniref:ATPase n=1 Tax=Mycobacterium deserti TaxID=2978347 RepID=A0ABT2M9J8_9MYCO|nr:ATPase [Mycobacterium deserti]MCT7658938.1 ATPase [Mycobacterium deserti]
MSGKHRNRKQRVAKFTALGAATATATALTVGIPPEPNRELDTELTHRVMNANVDLAAAVNNWPDPEDIPDLTAGLGTLGYDFSQFVAELLIRGVVENLNLSALAQATGLDLESLIEGLVGSPDALLADLLNGVLGELPIDLSPLLGEFDPLSGGVLLSVLQLLGITNAEGETSLLKLLGLVGLDLSDPLNLANLNVDGLNVITAGPAFTLLKLLGVDLGWVPSLPNAVANEINETEYLRVDVGALLNNLLEDLVGDVGPVDPLVGLLQGVLQNLDEGLPDVVNLRVPVTVGVGLGAFAAAMSYKKVLADLENQPGGGTYTGDPLLGSITILPMLLLFNPARPNGGAFARFYPLFRLLGIDTVNPETFVESRGGLGQLPLGLSLGGANLIPILADIGVQYHPSSDLAAWPNPVTLASNLMAALLPTYILRGVTLDTVPDQLQQQVLDALENLVGGKLGLNLYLTLPTATQPLLEPLYLLSDLTSIATLGMGSVNPFGMLANALAPAVEALTNLGYTDVVRNPDGTYTRTLDEAADPTPFFSFPSGINPVQVIPDVINLLVKGFQKEFFSGNPTAVGPNVITNLLGVLTGGGLLGPLGNLGGLLQGIIDNLNLPALTQPQQQNALMAATDVPDANARSFMLSTDDDKSAETPDATADLGAGGELNEEQPTGEELPEGLPEEEPAPEETVNEEPAEEVVLDDEEDDEEQGDEEEVVNEDQGGDEEQGDEEEQGDDEEQDENKLDEKKDDPTGPRHAKPGDDAPPPQSTNSPRHAKPDNEAPNTKGANGNDNDNAGGDSNNNDGSSAKAA